MVWFGYLFYLSAVNTLVLAFIASSSFVNIAVIITKDRDINSIALSNSIEWIHNVFARQNHHDLHTGDDRFLGSGINVLKYVIDPDDITNSDLLARNVTAASVILIPYHVDIRVCLLSEILHTPMIQYSDHHLPECEQYVINLLPSIEQSIHVFDAIFEEEQTTVIGVITVKEMSSVAVRFMSYGQKLGKYREYKFLGIVDLNDNETMYNMYSYIKQENIDSVIVVSFSFNCLDIVHVFRYTYNLTRVHWFLISPPARVTGELKLMQAKVTWVDIPKDKLYIKKVKNQIYQMKSDYQKSFQGYSKLDEKLHDAVLAVTEIVKQFDVKKLNHGCKKPFCSPPRITNDFNKLRRRLRFSSTSGEIRFTDTGYRNYSNLEINELSNTIEGSEIVGRWNEECGLLHWSREHQRRSAYCSGGGARKSPTKTSPIFRKKHLKITALPDSPFIFYNATSKKGNARFSGFCKDLLDKISEELEFSYELSIVPGETPSYGSCEVEQQGKSCIWNGVIGEIVSKRADAGIGSITITAEREEYVDFSKPYMDFTMTLIMEKTPMVKFDIFAFLKPFDPLVWLSILGITLTVTLVLYVIDRFSPKGCHNLAKERHSDVITGREFEFQNCIWFAAASLLQQGPDYTPFSPSARTLSATFWFFTLIVISTYTANLAAFFTIELQNTGINSLEDLAKQDLVKYGILGRGQTYSMFKNSELPLYNKMFNYMKVTNTFVSSSTEGVERVRQGGYAYLSEDPIILYQHQQRPCNTAVLRNLLEAKSYGLVLQSQSEWTDPISVVILDLREQGFIEKLRRKWWDDASKCFHHDTKLGLAKSITLSNLAGVYIIMVGGVVVSLIFLIFEMYFKNILPGKLTKKQYVFNRDDETLSAVREGGGGVLNGMKLSNRKQQQTLMLKNGDENYGIGSGEIKSTPVEYDGDRNTTEFEEESSPLSILLNDRNNQIPESII